MTDLNESSVEEQEMERLLPSFAKKGYICDSELQKITSMDTLVGRQHELYKIMMEKEQNAAVEIFNALRRMTSRIAVKRNNIAKHPLLIQVIADRVFGFLPTKDILNCRLVCHQWNMTSSHILSERVTIDFKTMEPSNFLNVWNHSLATDVKLQFFNFCDNEEGWNVFDIQNFFKEWGCNVTKLTFTANRLFTFHKNNGLSSFDITPWILMATNLIKLDVDVNYISREDKQDKTLIVIQLCKLNFIKYLSFEGKGCVISIEEIAHSNMRIHPVRIHINNVVFQKGGKRLDYFRLNDAINFSQATNIWLTNNGIKTEVGIDLASEILKADTMCLMNVKRLENCTEARGTVFLLVLLGSPFLERNQLEIRQMVCGHSLVNWSALPSTIEKLRFVEGMTFVTTPNSHFRLPKLTYLRLESCSTFQLLSVFTQCSNLVDIELGEAGGIAETVLVNVHWIPKSVKRLKIKSMNVKITHGGEGGDENDTYVLKLDTLILVDYLHCLDTDVCQIMSKIKPSVLIVTCTDSEKVINTTSICDFVCANKKLEKIVVGSAHDLHKKTPFDMSALSHFVKEKSNHYIFENLRENERYKENGNHMKEYIGKHLSLHEFRNYLKMDGIDNYC